MSFILIMSLMTIDAKKPFYVPGSTFRRHAPVLGASLLLCSLLVTPATATFSSTCISWLSTQVKSKTSNIHVEKLFISAEANKNYVEKLNSGLSRHKLCRNTGCRGIIPNPPADKNASSKEHSTL
ncbi:hypothetical protein AVEN_26038-1 [Araneus ventricosus]|uniref:Uncharacterized protein n=1 Tax=Araneus ventricosus TaxID=182803 RepID=A0A4Y2ML19_ARAVE|nr:hypothetical protein AVEN_26038-1 [Araneus ventricosus]